MFLEEFKVKNADIQIEQQEKDLAMLAEQMKIMQRRSEQLLTSFGIPKDELETYFENPRNFTGEAWQQLQEVRQDVQGFVDRLEKNSQTGYEKKAAYEAFAELRFAPRDWIKE